jgi:hypothetical protein
MTYGNSVYLFGNLDIGNFFLSLSLFFSLFFLERLGETKIERDRDRNRENPKAPEA